MEKLHEHPLFRQMHEFKQELKRVGVEGVMKRLEISIGSERMILIAEEAQAKGGTIDEQSARFWKDLGSRVSRGKHSKEG